MIVPIVILSSIFIGISILINKKNAADLLSGYNTMSNEERQNLDIELYIPYFKKFNLFLGISLFTISTFILYFVNASWSEIFMGTYPIIGYTFLILKSNQFYKRKTKKQNILTFFVVTLLLILLALIIIKI